MLRTYHFSRVLSLLIFAIKQENEHQLWQIWLNKDVGKDWPTFKKEQLKKVAQRTTPTAPIDEEKIMTDAFNFIQPRKDGDS